MTDYICLSPIFSLRSERKQPVAKNGGDGEGGLRFERRADYLPEQTRRENCEPPTDHFWKFI